MDGLWEGRQSLAGNTDIVDIQGDKIESTHVPDHLAALSLPNISPAASFAGRSPSPAIQRAQKTFLY
jgi:hypothetical protein